MTSADRAGRTAGATPRTTPSGEAQNQAEPVPVLRSSARTHRRRTPLADALTYLVLLVAAVLTMTALFGSCPLYSILGCQSCKSRK